MDWRQRQRSCCRFDEHADPTGRVHSPDYLNTEIMTVAYRGREGGTTSNYVAKPFQLSRCARVHLLPR